MVDLVGEALFSVTQRAEQPFVVRTGAVVTKVLGTKFNVRRYPADRATQVAVLTGRVASGGHATPLVLSAGTVGDITDSSATLSLNDDPELIASWTQGHLVFHNAPVSTVLATLGRWYGYEFRATDTMITTGHMSVRLSTDRANEALNMVRTVLGVTMTFEGNVITLRPERGEKGASRSSRTHELSINPKPEVGR
jgi:ferric-dicitrate binding protein FerR (iron transport regulator)